MVGRLQSDVEVCASRNAPFNSGLPKTLAICDSIQGLIDVIFSIRLHYGLEYIKPKKRSKIELYLGEESKFALSRKNWE